MEKIRRSLLPVFTFARIDIKRLFRDKVGIFFVFFFPIMFLLVFGGLFGGDNNVSFKLALFNRSDSEFAAIFEEQLKGNSELFSIDEIASSTEDSARGGLRRGSVDAIITIPESFGLTPEGRALPSGQVDVVYDRGNEQAGAALGSILESIFAEMNSELVLAETPFTLSIGPTESEGLRQLDYLFAGMLGFTLLSLGIFGPTTVFPRMKEKGILRRYHTTPIRVWQYFAGNVLSNAVIGLMATSLMFIVALVVFRVNMRGDFLSLSVLVVLGVVVMFGIGLAAGGWAKNENQAAPLSNLIAFPMMFLSGVFFPRFLMPEWLQTMSGVLPLTPLVDGLRLIINEGQTLLDIGTQLGLLGVWAVVIYTAAFKLFRWE